MYKYAIIVRELFGDIVLDCSVDDPNTFINPPAGDKLVYVHSDLEFDEFKDRYYHHSGKVDMRKLSHSYDSECHFVHH